MDLDIENFFDTVDHVHLMLRLGQRVRILGGALAGMDGILTREKGASRVVVNVDLLQRAVAVEIDSDLIGDY